MPPGAVIALICSVALLLVPRRWAVAVFVIGALYCPMGAGLAIGSLSFPPGRILALAGLLRLLFRGEWPTLAKPDYAAFAFAIAFVWSGLFRDDIGQAVVARCGYALDTIGSYFFFRGMIKSHEDLVRCAVALLILYIPVALEMLYEAKTGSNLFSKLGGLDSKSVVRDGRIRAQGPFRHSILAGTMAAALLPLAVGLLKENRRFGVIGIITVVLAVLACASSGPIMGLAAAIAALGLWAYRYRLALIRTGAIVTLIALHIVMNDPVWFLIARIKIVGGSTGYHRARLIDRAIKHFDEWWFAGTDYTRHWMPTGVSWSPDHSDITNHFIQFGVLGGLPLMFGFIWLLKRCFSEVGFAVSSTEGDAGGRDFFYWCLGAWLFAHVVSMIGVSYYDQSLVLFFGGLGVVATIGQVVGAELAEVSDSEEVDEESGEFYEAHRPTI